MLTDHGSLAVVANWLDALWVLLVDDWMEFRGSLVGALVGS
jgi:hypothetical protein